MAFRGFEGILEDQDKQFVRVLEDLIEVLIEENVISLDRFPDKAVEKILMRRRMRMATPLEMDDVGLASYPVD